MFAMKIEHEYEISSDKRFDWVKQNSLIATDVEGQKSDGNNKYPFS